ncbi:MAG: DNA repair protein RadC [Patescibacteria group bacterium]|nr:DNA repair protein RadC [Patescibacteria group bacterium]
MKIKDLPFVDRPREKLLKYGVKKLTTTELLAILLRTGTRDINVIELASRVLKIITTNNLPSVTFDDLIPIHGLGKTKALEIIAAMELGKRLLKEREPLIALSAQHVYESIKDIASHKKEHFIALYLDTRNKEIGREVISIGTLNASIVHPREVFEPAIRLLAHAVIVAHNHPSGDPQPSHQDILITQRLKEAGKILDISLIDHLVVTHNGFISMKEVGLL